MDMETLGIREDAIVLSIAVLSVPTQRPSLTPKEFTERYGLFCRINIEDEERDYNRSMDLKTIKWWVLKNFDVFHQELTSKNYVSMKDAINQVLSHLSCNSFFTDKNNFIWSRGLFEVKLWESMLRDLNIPNNIMFWQWRDTRTACDVLCGDPNGKLTELDGLNKHNPLTDCVLDFYRLHSLGYLK